MKIPRYVQTANRATVNNPFERDNMVNFHAFRAVGINIQQLGFGSPRRGSILNVFSSVVESRRICRVIRPSFSARFIDCFSTFVVGGFLLLCNLFSIGLVGKVTVSSPFVLVISILAKIFRASGTIVSQGARFASIADERAFLVELGARFFGAAGRADFPLKSGFRHCDIIATNGAI